MYAMMMLIAMGEGCILTYYWLLFHIPWNLPIFERDRTYELECAVANNMAYLSAL